MNRARIEAEITRRSQMPYTYELRREDDGTWFARVRELRGCMSAADTDEEALAMLKDAFASWIQSALEDGAEIPDPYDVREYSGRFVIRLTQSVHRDLVIRADREGVSLNQLILADLASANATGTTQRTLPPTVSFLLSPTHFGAVMDVDIDYNKVASTSAAIAGAVGFSIPFNTFSMTPAPTLCWDKTDMWATPLPTRLKA